MYTSKGLPRCKYCSAHKSFPLRLARKIASGRELVTISTAEANNEVKYICICERCKSLALRKVPVRAWWQQLPIASVPAHMGQGPRLLLPAPLLSGFCKWQRLPAQKGWGQFCCTSTTSSKYSDCAKICLKMKKKNLRNVEKGKQMGSTHCSIKRTRPAWSMNALGLPGLWQCSTHTLLRKRRENSQYSL